jgi:peptide deformylase
LKRRKISQYSHNIMTEPTVILPDWANTLNTPPTLIPFFDPVMTKIPEKFDFETNGELAPLVAKWLKQAIHDNQVVGISANQAGLPLKVFAIGTDDTFRAFFNPVISGASKEKSVYEERCVTLPEFSLTLQRPYAIVITYQDEAGIYHTNTFEGLTARIILHEYDHMQGINFTQHASNFKLKWEIKKFRKRLKRSRR